MRRSYISILSLAILVMFGVWACDEATTEPENGDQQDMEAPTVSITAPAGVDTVSGEVTITADASDNNSVDSVQFLIDGERVSSVTTTPYEFTWNSITYADTMEHEISAKAFDPAENIGEAEAVGVVVVPAVMSFGDNVQPIFSASCAVSGCHDAATATRGLSLASGDAYSNIVDEPSSEMQSLDRIEPGDPANSFLYLKINPSPPSGERMPFGGPYLTEEQILTIRFWIEQGAKDN